MSADLLEVIAAAYRSGGSSVTLTTLIERIGFEQNPLAGAREVETQIRRGGCELVPALNEGGLDTERFIRPVAAGEQTAADVASAVKRGEGPDAEFKSSFLYDRRRAEHDRSARPADLKSDAVRDSVLKSICAFLNSGGGDVYIGVADGGEVVGIEDDFQFTGGGDSWSQQCDRWELALRSVLQTRFYEPSAIGGAVSVAVCQCGGRTVARIRVTARKRFSYVKWGTDYTAFVRRGNRTERLEPFEIEELVIERRGQRE